MQEAEQMNVRNDFDEQELREYADMMDDVFQKAAHRICDNSTVGRLDRCLLKYTGIGGVLFQAVKLIVAAHRKPAQEATNDLLDAMGYAALACVELERVENAKLFAKARERGYEEELDAMLNPERPDDTCA